MRRSIYPGRGSARKFPKSPAESSSSLRERATTAEGVTLPPLGSEEDEEEGFLQA